MIIKSFGEFDANHKWANKYGRIHFKKLRINSSSTDKALLRTEVSIITRYAWEKYDDKTLGTVTIDPEASVWKNYYDVMSDGSHKLKEGYDVHKKVSDVLGVVEFFVNRFNSLSDEQIKSVMVSARCYIKSIRGENDCEGLKKNRLKICDHETRDGGEPRLHLSDSNKITKDSEITIINSKKSAEDPRNPSFGFANLFDHCRTLQTPETSIPEEGFEDLFVLLKDDNDEIMSLYESFWKNRVSNGEEQLNASNTYIPIGPLLEKLESVIQGLDCDHPLRYVIESDLRSAEMRIVHPLDSFLGPIGDRDRDFESSDSDIRLIAVAFPDYLRSVATYARLVHAVLLESNVDDKTIELAFNVDSMVRLCDPVLMDRSYPPILRFTPGAEKIIAGYRKNLKTIGYCDKEGYDMARENPQDDLAPEWPDVVANAGRMRDRMDANTTVTIRALTDSTNISAGSDPFHSIIVSTEADREVCERFISTLPLPRSVSFLVFPSEVHYTEKRYDLFGITEVGVTDSTELLDLHRNGIDRRRRRARNMLNKYLEGKEFDAETIVGWTLKSLVNKSDTMEESCR